MSRLLILALSILLFGFSGSPVEEAGTVPDDRFGAMRSSTVTEQLISRNIQDQNVLDAMGRIPRHLFVHESLKDKAYSDRPLPIDEGQTISQPYIVALMTEVLALKPSDRVLEIGTGSGYQAAVLAEIVKEVYTIEIKEDLSRKAGNLLAELGYRNIKTRYADGYFGWDVHAPFDAIIITAAANHIPPPLIKQLKDGGRLIIPLGSTLYYQTLTILRKNKDDLYVTQMGDVVFVPMTGEVKERAQ